MNPTKLVLHFSDFSMIFYAIYKKQPNHKYYWSYPFAGRPWERNLLLQCGPWAAGRRGGVNSGEARRSFRWGRMGVGSRGYGDSVWALGRGGGGLGGAAWRRQPRPAAARPAPARMRPGATDGASW
jgi:hypothetical protein